MGFDVLVAQDVSDKVVLGGVHLGTLQTHPPLLVVHHYALLVTHLCGGEKREEDNDDDEDL